jgi:hypothetical protein
MFKFYKETGTVNMALGKNTQSLPLEKTHTQILAKKQILAKNNNKIQ